MILTIILDILTQLKLKCISELEPLFSIFLYCSILRWTFSAVHLVTAKYENWCTKNKMYKKKQKSTILVFQSNFLYEMLDDGNLDRVSFFANPESCFFSSVVLHNCSRSLLLLEKRIAEFNTKFFMEFMPKTLSLLNATFLSWQTGVE